jgi:hypothetical protein
MELDEAIIDMYTHLHMFQEIVVTIINQQSRVQTKNTHMNTIRESIDDIDKWITENNDAPVELPHPSSMERKTNIYSLEHCQQVVQRAIK